MSGKKYFVLMENGEDTSSIQNDFRVATAGNDETL